MCKRGIGLFLLVLGFLFVGCEGAKVYTYEDFLGGWELPNDTHISIMQDSSDPSEKNLDIRWLQGTSEYFAMVRGTANGNVFTGTYKYIITADSGTGAQILYYGDDPEEPEIPVTISLTMFQDKPKLTCTGDTPLGGKVFSM